MLCPCEQAKTNAVSGVWAKGKRVRKFLGPKNREAAGGGPGLWVVRSGVVLLDAAGAGARGGRRRAGGAGW